jgi:L-seryl-tRNA(Ser) seleniumtransferase
VHKLTTTRRDIPAVTKVIDALGETDLPRPLLVDVVRRELKTVRASDEIPDFRSIIDLVRRSTEALRASRIQPVINGTGIIIHTNFGRAPLSFETIRALNDTAAGYSNLEFDLTTGERGHRGGYIERALAVLCGAESAAVVNNCAAALMLIVQHFARTKREVIVPRGELVQIGGGFRIGEIIEAAGAQLHEIGATNKVTLNDYARAITRHTAMILKVHRSNFFMSGFVESPSSVEIAALAQKRRIPFVEDLGSGAVIDSEQFGMVEHEPTPSEALRAGANLVSFSGDKLFGGPQVGIIVGKKRFVSALRREPLFRALRCDKLCLTALQSTVDLHLNQKTTEIPTIALLQISKDELRARAALIFSRLQGLPFRIVVGRGKAKVGGGTLPRSIMSSITIDILIENAREFARKLRGHDPPVIGYIAEGWLKLDLRTIFPHQDDLVVDAIRTACASTN